MSLEGLASALVRRYLEQGLLQHLALLSDIGSQVELAAVADLDAFSATMHGHGVHAKVLPAAPRPAEADLACICAADRAQQEQMIAALKGRRDGVVVCVFDMVAQLGQLYGTHLNAEQQIVMRDVYARMDEIVGKAMSFVNEETMLLVVIPPHPRFVQSNTAARRCGVFTSRLLDTSEIRSEVLTGIVLRLLDSGCVQH